MKSIKAKIFGLVLVVALIGFYSCDKEKLQPVLSFAIQPGYIANDTILAVGDTIKVLLDITWNGKHKVKKVEMIANDQLAAEYQVDIDEGQFSITLIKGLNETEIWDFRIIDEGGNSDMITLTLTKDPTSKYSAIKYYDSIFLGAQSNLNRPGFMSLTNATYYNLDAALPNSSAIDLFFYFTVAEKGTIAAPASNIGEGVFPSEQAPDKWDVRNITVFQKVEMIPETFYMMYHDAYILENFDPDLTTDKASDLTLGDTYLFQLNNGKMGIFYVLNVEESEDGEVNIAIKIQE